MASTIPVPSTAMETNVSAAITRPTHWVRPTPGNAASASATTSPTGAAHTTGSSRRCRISGAHGRGNSTTNAPSPAQPMTYTTWVRSTYSHRTRSPAPVPPGVSAIVPAARGTPPPASRIGRECDLPASRQRYGRGSSRDDAEPGRRAAPMSASPVDRSGARATPSR
jgi:hypothetical protein